MGGAVPSAGGRRGWANPTELGYANPKPGPVMAGPRKVGGPPFTRASALDIHKGTCLDHKGPADGLCPSSIHRPIKELF